MKKLSQFLAPLKKIFAYGERIKPTRDWFVLLGISFVLVVLSIGWNIFLFNRFENGTSVAQTTLPMQQGVANSVTQVQTIFQQRATEEENYQKNYTFVDPSRPGS